MVDWKFSFEVIYFFGSICAIWIARKIYKHQQREKEFDMLIDAQSKLYDDYNSVITFYKKYIEDFVDKYINLSECIKKLTIKPNKERYFISLLHEFEQDIYNKLSQQQSLNEEEDRKRYRRIEEICEYLCNMPCNISHQEQKAIIMPEIVLTDMKYINHSFASTVKYQPYISTLLSRLIKITQELNNTIRERRAFMSKDLSKPITRSQNEEEYEITLLKNIKTETLALLGVCNILTILISKYLKYHKKIRLESQIPYNERKYIGFIDNADEILNQPYVKLGKFRKILDFIW